MVTSLRGQIQLPLVPSFYLTQDYVNLCYFKCLHNILLSLFAFSVPSESKKIPVICGSPEFFWLVHFSLGAASRDNIHNCFCNFLPDSFCFRVIHWVQSILFLMPDKLEFLLAFWPSGDDIQALNQFLAPSRHSLLTLLPTGRRSRNILNNCAVFYPTYVIHYCSWLPHTPCLQWVHTYSPGSELN